MTSFAEVDPIIDAWAAATAKKLFIEWAGRPARFAYLPGLRPFECFQISIDQPLSGRVAVLARSVDTDDESEFEQRWEGATEILPAMLEEATDRVRTWVNRLPANGSSPPLIAVQRSNVRKARFPSRVCDKQLFCDA